MAFMALEGPSTVRENNPSDVIKGYLSLGLESTHFYWKVCVTNWERGVRKTGQGGSNKKTLLRCIMGNVGFSGFSD